MFGRLFSRKSPPAGIALPAAAPLAAREAIGLSNDVYPPQGPDIPVPTPDRPIEDQAELIAMLCTHPAAPSQQLESRFAALIKIERTAENVNRLPGGASKVFSGGGGLFRTAVGSTFTISRSGDGLIFSTSRYSIEASGSKAAFQLSN